MLSFLLSGCNVAGEAQQLVVTTEPESGRIVADFPETSNITLVCRVRTEDGSARGTSWFTQTAQDREDGRQFQQVLPNDPDFFISGVIVETQAGSFIDDSILTIASLTSDLDTAIIFCGFDRPLANFTFRLYCKNIADILLFINIIPQIHQCCWTQER